MSKIIFKKISILFTYLAFFVIVVLGSFSVNSTIYSYAAGEPKGLELIQPSEVRCIFYQKTPNGTTPSNYFKGCSESNSLLSIILKFLQDIAPYVTTILLIIGGYEFFSDENAKKTSAQSTIYAALTGYSVILLAPILTQVITDTFTPGKDNAPLNTTAIKILLDQIINILIDLSSIVAVVCIVLAGYAYFLEFFVNNGKQEGKLRGRDLLSAGIMGLIVTTLARPIVAFIKSTLISDKASLNLDTSNVITLIKNVLGNFLIPLSSLLSLVFVVISAYLWLTAGQDEERVKNARKFLNNALIGLVIVLLSTVIVQLIIFFIQPAISFIPGGTNANEIIKSPSATPVPVK
jgi:Type IV secretion system pilin